MGGEYTSSLFHSIYHHEQSYGVRSSWGGRDQGGRAQHDFGLAGKKQPDIPLEVDTVRLETSRTEAAVLKKLSLAGIAKLSRLKYSRLSWTESSP